MPNDDLEARIGVEHAAHRPTPLVVGNDPVGQAAYHGSFEAELGRGAFEFVGRSLGAGGGQPQTRQTCRGDPALPKLSRWLDDAPTARRPRVKRERSHGRWWRGQSHTSGRATSNLPGVPVSPLRGPPET